ncbi:MAG TPA: HlyD family secretion protein [Roseiarcus sp.]|nr:HlyD family secretion protein [Roseiarcus sp.]
MSGVELKANDAKTPPPIKRRSVLSSLRVVPVLATLAAVALAAALGYQAWQYYMGSPWTRDGTVRAYVVKVAPQVAGEIVQLPIADDQFVHKGDLLMLIDPRNYSIAVRQAQAAVEQARAVADNANAEMTRRLKLSDIAVTMEERQTYISQAATAAASYQSALANLDQARVNFRRTQVRSPVNGYITNLTAQLGDYADVGALQLSIVNSDSFWVDAYFEETALGRIHKGDAATIKLMGYSPLLRGRVQGLARGINVPNAAPDASGLASVNPIFTFVRLAQRVPARIHIDEVPEGVKLVAGLTATVQIEPYKAPSAPGPAPASEPMTKAKPKPAPSQVAAHAAPQPAPVTMAPAQTSGRAPAEAAPWQALSHPALQSAEPQAATQAPPKAPQQQNAPPPAAPDAGANELAVSAPPSAQASAAAAAADADLKTLEEQIAANPPSGTPSLPSATNRPSDSSADMMPPSEYLGRTIDLFGDQGAAPEQKRRSPESIRRRARSRWRHYGEP